MGTQDNNSKVIPLFPNAADAKEASFELGTMRDMQLARRRGFDTVEPIAPARPAATPAAAAATPPEPARNVLSTSRLSALFIESLDDMIRRTPCQADAGEWPAKSTPTLEKVAVDIVDMLFGIVVGEPLVPRGIKEALLRAQLPVLQLAMREPAFFSDWQHPARQLLNELAPMIRSYIERGGEMARFEREFIAGLERVLDDLAPNGAAFAAFRDALANFASNAPAAEASDESEAWERAQRAARDYLERPLPQIARDFLSACWIDVLQRTALRHAPDSPQWQDAVAAIEDLAWSLTPKDTEDDRLQLIALVPALLARLNRGLDLIDLPREERRPFFDALVEVHSKVLRAELTPPPPPALPQREESAGEQVQRLARGDWVEFALADGSISRERLTWISPQRGILVFSNHQGQRAIQISPEDLRDLVAEHKAMIIFDQPDTESNKNSA